MCSRFVRTVKPFWSSWQDQQKCQVTPPRIVHRKEQLVYPRLEILDMDEISQNYPDILFALLLVLSLILAAR